MLEVSFYRAKAYLSDDKRRPFGIQKAAFYEPIENQAVTGCPQKEI